MACSPVNAKSHFHARSNSLPSRPHPLVPQINEHLFRLKASEATLSSSISNNINGLSDLYDLVNNLLLLPNTQQALAQECNGKQVDEMLDRSLRLMDMCGATKDALIQIKEETKELESVLRRRRGGESRLAHEVGEYLVSRKKANKAIRRSLRVLKSSACSCQENETIAMISILREVEGVTIAVFESLSSYLSGLKAQSKQSRWSLVSKLMHTKRITYDAEASGTNEFETALCKMKENTQELQSILRRRRGDESRLANKVGEYLSSRKKSNKVIHKSLRDLKSRCKVTSSENETPAIIEILREVEGVALAVFESLLSYISVAGPWYRS
ncbi:hypothetical protein WN944_028399 [Citrus x changshan-huyou]|uniref:Uncharacterized protein n=1 Tax=Citrus x changshan-huyou TaxID=2935761 RepID=A0AAP0LLS6_9ROSI